MLALVREKGPPAVAEEMLPKLLSEATCRGRPDIVDRVRTLILANSTDAIASAITALMTRPDSTPLLQGIHCPTLILVGADDGVTPPALSEALHDAIGGSELVTIAGAGHLSSLEQPAAFDAALARFLEHRV
jgi:pimeloyl-ACP methyl ester carboxylesterase